MSEEIKKDPIAAKTVFVPTAPVEPSIDDQIKAAKLQAQQLEIQLKNEELTAKKLEIQERLANIDESKKRQGDREIKRKQAENDLKQKARVFGQQRATDALRQQVCSHRKGGMAHSRDLRVLQFVEVGHQRFTSSALAGVGAPGACGAVSSPGSA